MHMRKYIMYIRTQYKLIGASAKSTYFIMWYDSFFPTYTYNQGRIKKSSEERTVLAYEQKGVYNCFIFYGSF